MGLLKSHHKCRESSGNNKATVQLPSCPVVQGLQHRCQKRAELGVSSPHSALHKWGIWYLIPHKATTTALADGSCQLNHVEPCFSPTNYTLHFKHPLLSCITTKVLCSRLKRHISFLNRGKSVSVDISMF
jgi:hypothetical protein